MTQLRLVSTSPACADPLAQLDELLAGLLPRMPRVRAILAASSTPIELVGLVGMLPGATAGERRAVMRAARTGAIVGAAKVGRTWRAPRASVEAWLHELGPRVVIATPEAADVDELEDLRESLTRAARRRPGAR